MATVDTLTLDEVLTIRRRLAGTSLAGRDFGSVEPLRLDALASAVERQNTGIGDVRKYKTPEHTAAALFYGVALNHAFENGNKRTALVCMLVLLDKNRVLLVDADEDDLYEMATRVAAHEFLEEGRGDPDTEVEGIYRWLKPRTRTYSLGDSRLRFSELRERLQALDCEFDSPSGNFIKIRRSTPGGTYTHKTGYPRHNFEVSVQEIKRIRWGLRLDELHGIDSGAFYDLEETVDGFANEYRQVLSRLADA